MSDEYHSLLQCLSKISRLYGIQEAFVIRRKIRREKILYCRIPGLIACIEAYFRKNKIGNGAKILFWGTNCPEYALLLLTTFSCGRIGIPVDYRTSEENIKAIINKTKPAFAFISKYFKGEFLVKENIKIFYIEDLLENIKEENLKGDFGKLLKNKNYTDPKRLVEIVFTSGTTGLPKGVEIRQKNILVNLVQVDSSLPDLTGARMISLLPLSHMFEQVVGLFLAITHGASVYYLPRVNSYRMALAFKEYRPTHQIFVPQLLKMLWIRIEEKAREKGKFEKMQTALGISAYLPKTIRKMLFADIHKELGGSLKFFACGGAPLDPEIGLNWERVGIPVIEGYGATEVTAIATVNPYKNIKYGSAGKPVEGINLTAGNNKEITIQSEAVSSGYYQDKERTRAVFSQKGYRTGDVGELGEDGYLYIKGRDVFKIVLPSGEKVFVEDLESQIIKDKRVREVCVVAQRVKDGDRIHAYFLLQNNVKDNLKNIVSEINSTLESKQQITSYAYWAGDDFPRTPTLKVDRKQIYDLANKKISQKDIVQKDTAGNFLDIIDVLAKVSEIPKERIKKTDLLASDLDLDSLSRVELVSLAEEYLGFALDEGKISQKTTVADLIKLTASVQSLEEVKLPVWQFTHWGQLIHLLALKIILFPLHSFVVKLKTQKIIPQIPKGSIIIFNHPGVMDGVCVLRILAKQGNLKVVTDATASVWENKGILGLIAEVLVGGVPLYETGQKMFEVLKLNSDLLDRGYNLLFAPQGTMQRSEKEAPFKMGIGYLLKELNRPVTIVRIKGYREIWPAPKEDIANAKLKDYLRPKKRGEVEVIITKSFNKDWSKMSVIQITNYIEEKYREI